MTLDQILSLFGQINKWTLDQILSLVGQIATWFTLVVVFLTLREMEKQRKSAQKPELIIPTIHVRGYFTKKKEDELLIPKKWSIGDTQANSKGVTSDVEILDEFPELKIYNIGFGAAKNIKIKWQIDNIRESINAISDNSYKNSIPIVAKLGSNLLNPTIDITMNGMQHFSSIGGTQEYDYLLPSSIISSGLNTRLPFWLTNMLLPALICLDLSLQGQFVSIPSIKIQLSYEDVGNVKYVKQYKLDIVAGYIYPRGRIFQKSLCAFGFEFKEIRFFL